MASSMHVFALELYLTRRKDQYDNIVAMVTGMLCTLPVTIYFKPTLFRMQPPIHNFMTPILVSKESSYYSTVGTMLVFRLL